MYEPGFGLFGSMGIICFVGCIFVTAKTVLQGIILTTLFFVIIIIMIVIFFTMLSKNRLPKHLVLHESTSAELGFSGTEDMQYLMGKSGMTVSICRPTGNVDFDGVKLDVVSRGEYIDKGRQVEVIEIEGSRIVVKEKV
jgi:membrane-bound ClpP family serine protease